MRFIIKEQSYEKILAAGQYRYELDGEPTGAVESWRMTAVDDEYRFLRVDLDARAAKSGHSYLYHAVVNADERIERLKYRFWGDGLEIVGDAVLEDTAVTAARIVNNQTFDDVLELPQGYRFWFPSVAGLHFAGWLGNEPKTAVTLNGQIGGIDTLAAQIVDFEYHMLITDYMEMEIMGKLRKYVPYKLTWNDQTRIIQRSYDESGWPLGMVRMDKDYVEGLTAVATRHINYQRITNPGN
ncbi:MAG: hypothetical protein GY803_00800 [Chloroflexi bacterium]|nr:hypothetical protein [Chloroflexota bacterium]